MKAWKEQGSIARGLDLYMLKHLNLYVLSISSFLDEHHEDFTLP